MSSILFIEDSQEMAQALSLALATTYRVVHARTGLAGLAAIRREGYDAILLDLGLPDMSGIEVCKTLRNTGCKLPILVITGEHQVLTKIKLLDAGANDYLTKPFSVGELKARLRAAQRSASALPIAKRLIVGDLTLDTEKHTALRGGQAIPLRRKEFHLLKCLMQRAGAVVPRDTLSDQAWHHDDSPWPGTIDVHIKYLRDKIDRPFEQPLIHTVHGIGYKIEAMSDGLLSNH